MKIIAHRGYSAKYPENTLAAFRAAAKLPIYGVEFDVHLTKDRELVVIHDEKIDRTSNGSGFVKDMTLEQLRQFDYGIWFGEEFAGEKIPTLSEVLEVFAITNLHINIEIKSDIFIYEGIEELVLREVTSRKLEDRVILSSFDHEAVQKVAELAPNIENAPLFANPVLNLRDYLMQVPAKALHVSLPSALRYPVRQAIKAGEIVRVYTVNEIEHAERLLPLGVDSIFTDEVELMLEFMNREVREL